MGGHWSRWCKFIATFWICKRLTLLRQKSHVFRHHRHNFVLILQVETGRMSTFLQEKRHVLRHQRQLFTTEQLHRSKSPPRFDLFYTSQCHRGIIILAKRKDSKSLRTFRISNLDISIRKRTKSLEWTVKEDWRRTTFTWRKHFKDQ